MHSAELRCGNRRVLDPEATSKTPLQSMCSCRNSYNTSFCKATSTALLHMLQTPQHRVVRASELETHGHLRAGTVIEDYRSIVIEEKLVEGRFCLGLVPQRAMWKTSRSLSTTLQLSNATELPRSKGFDRQNAAVGWIELPATCRRKLSRKA